MPSLLLGTTADSGVSDFEEVLSGLSGLSGAAFDRICPDRSSCTSFNLLYSFLPDFYSSCFICFEIGISAISFCVHLM